MTCKLIFPSLLNCLVRSAYYIYIHTCSYCTIDRYHIFSTLTFCLFVWLSGVEIYCHLKSSSCFRCLSPDVWSWSIWKALVRNPPEDAEDSGDPENCVGDPMTGEAGSPSDPMLKLRIFRGGWAVVVLSSKSCLISWRNLPFLYTSTPLMTFFSGWKCGMST